MAEIKLTINDTHVAEVLNAFDSIYPNRPENTTKAVWAKAKVIAQVKAIVKEYREREAQKLASSGEVDIT